MLRGHARPPAVGRPELGGFSPWTLRPFAWFSAPGGGTGLGHWEPFSPVRSLACLDPESLVGGRRGRGGGIGRAQPRSSSWEGRGTAGGMGLSSDSTARFPAGRRWETLRGWQVTQGGQRCLIPHMRYKSPLCLCRYVPCHSLLIILKPRLGPTCLVYVACMDSLHALWTSSLESHFGCPPPQLPHTLSSVLALLISRSAR